MFQFNIIFSIFFGWSIGANDTANIFGPSVTSGIIKYRTSIILAAIFVLAGALIEGSKCIETISEISILNEKTTTIAIFSSALVMAVMTYLGMPASSSQAIVGSIIGIGTINGSADFSKLFKIILCWLLTPLGAIVITIIFYKFFTWFFRKYLKNIYTRNAFLLWAILISGSYGAYALGANNTANISGVFVSSKTLSPIIASLIAGLSIALGILTYSHKVMTTIGNKIVPLGPFSAFIVTLANATVIHIFTQFKVPVSSTQAIVGAIIGIGLLKGIRTVSKTITTQIALSWFLTPILAGTTAYLLTMIF